jgi:hypothetical protein
MAPATISRASGIEALRDGSGKIATLISPTARKVEGSVAAEHTPSQL